MAQQSQHGLGLRGRLIVLVLLSIVPMLAFAGMLLAELATAQRTTLEARVQDTARSLGQIVDQEVARAQATITALAASYYLDVDDLARFHAQALRVVSDSDHWVILFNLDGDQLVNTLQPFGEPLPKAVKAPALAEVLRTGRPAVTNLLPSGSVFGRPVVGTAVPVRRNGEIVYVLAATFSTDTLSRLLTAQNLPPAWRAGIQDRRGNIIARNAAADQFVGKRGSEPLHARSEEAGEGVLQLNTMEGDPAYAAFTRSNLTGWTTAVAVPQAILRAPLDEFLTLLLAGGGAMLLVGLAFATRSARQIARPVQTLTEAATTLGHGGIPGVLSTGIPEITAVGTALNAAAVELRERQARLQAALDVAAMGIWRWDIGSDLVEWDAATSRLLDLGGSAARHKPAYFLQHLHPDDRARMGKQVEQWVQNPTDIEAEFRILRSDGSVRWLFERGKLYTTADGTPDYMIGAIVDITDRKRAEAALADAHERTLDILESIADAFYALDADRRFTYANQRALELWGKQADEVMGRGFTDVFPGAEDSEAWRAQTRAAAERRPIHVETVSPILNRWIAISIYPTAGGGLTVYFRDITARKDAERRQNLLIGELNHRVKNTLAAVQSIVAQGLRGTRDPEMFARALQGRLLALSGAHDILTRTAWESADLAEVIQAALMPFDGGQSRVRVEGPAIQIRPNVAVALSMAFHELATNAAKYGALSKAEGSVAITWALDERATTAIIHWRESGGPAVAPPTRRGFGSRLIERGLAYELDSEVTLAFLPTGVECEIRLPVPAQTDA